MEQPSLTARQTQILKALIDEYITTAEPVGSLSLEKKYDLGVSPATIRNEMANLTSTGYLRQPHTSAGRVPSPQAMKFYINQLMDEKQVSLTEEVKAKTDVGNLEDNFEKIMEYATRALAKHTSALAVATTDEGSTWSHGYSNIFDSPEFFSYQVCQSIFTILDEQKRLQELFFKHLSGLSPIEVLFGEETGWDFFEPVGIVATRFTVGGRQGAIGIIGPYRLNYSSVIPMVRYYGQLINQYANTDDQSHQV
jgi:heat-inducible transcriptional repressor